LVVTGAMPLALGELAQARWWSLARLPAFLASQPAG